jgi:predicted nucleotidyltransferase
LKAVVAEHRDEIFAAVRRHRGRRVRIFGSLARGTDHADSDIDFLVDFENGSSLFDLMHLTEELERLLSRPVDVISAGGLKPRDLEILDEAIVI